MSEEANNGFQTRNNSPSFDTMRHRLLLSTQAFAVCTVSFSQLKAALDQAVVDEGSDLATYVGDHR
jgi:hypothetical protein